MKGSFIILAIIVWVVRTDSDESFEYFKADMEDKVQQLALKMGQAFTNFIENKSTQCRTKVISQCEGTSKRLCYDQFPKPKGCLSPGAQMGTEPGISFAKGVTKNTICEEDRKFICASAELDDDFLRLDEDRNDKYGRAFIGTTSGVLKSYPSMKVSCGVSDFRSSQWFRKAISVPKNMVFMVNTRRSMTQELDQGKSIMKQMISELKESDKFAVIAFDEQSRSVQNPTITTKHATQTVTNKLFSLLASQSTQVNFTNAFQRAFSFISDTTERRKDPFSAVCRSKAQNFLILITDEHSLEIDNTTQDIMFQQYLEQMALLIDFKPIILIFGEKPSNDQLTEGYFFKQISCQHGGIMLHLQDNFTDFQDTLMKYLQTIERDIEICTPIWTGPHEDFLGFRDVMTVSMPVYSYVNGLRQLLGVAGIDVSEDELNEFDRATSQIIDELVNSPILHKNIVENCHIDALRQEQTKCQLNCSQNQYQIVSTFCELEPESNLLKIFLMSQSKQVIRSAVESPLSNLLEFQLEQLLAQFQAL